MLRLFLIICILTVSLIVNVNAQNIEGVNARLDGMAGSGVADDIGWTVGNPRSISGFKDLIQGSALLKKFDGKGNQFGRIMAIKSIGEKLSLGLTLNNKRVMNKDFVGNMFSFYEFGFGEHLNINKVDLPHINLCYEINDVFTIGAGLYSEYNKSRSSKIDTLTNELNPDTADIIENLGDGKYSAIRPVIDAKIVAGKLSIVPIFSIGLPRFQLSQYEKINDSIVISKNSNVSAKDAVNLKTGIQLWGEIGNNFLIGGFWFDNVKYNLSKMKFKNTKDSKDTLIYGAEYSHRSFDWFVGIQNYFSDDLFFAPEYNGGVYVSTADHSKQVTGDSTEVRSMLEKNFYVYHFFRLGMEKTLKAKKFLDELSFRTGFVYKYYHDSYTKKDVNGGILNEKNLVMIKCNATSSDGPNNGTRVSAGIGLKKGRATIDMSVDLINWGESGIISGPKPAIVTITVDMGKKAKKETSSVLPEVETVQSEQYSETVATEDQADDSDLESKSDASADSESDENDLDF